MNRDKAGNGGTFPLLHRIFNLINPRKDNPNTDKQLEHYFRGFVKPIKYGSLEYLRISNARLSLISEGYRHHPNYFDVMVKDEQLYLIEENGNSKKMGAINEANNNGF